MSSILQQLKGHLIVSCQPVDDGPMDRPEITAAFALAALAGGAKALRIEGIKNIRAVRAVTDAPMIGLIKQDLEDSPVRITPYVQQALDIIEAGADIVAFDMTDRQRPEPVADIISAIKSNGKLAMADCSCIEDGHRAVQQNCDILGSTMSGYTGGPVPEGPDLELVSALSHLGRLTIAEGRYQQPENAEQAILHGADSVVVGSAITRPEHVTSWFTQAVYRAVDKRGA